jgi:hypothetical protein
MVENSDHNVEGSREGGLANGTQWALGPLFKTIPVRSEVTILLESDDVAAALFECERMERQHFDRMKYMNSPERREMRSEREAHRVERVEREEQADSKCVQGV